MSGIREELLVSFMRMSMELIARIQKTGCKLPKVTLAGSMTALWPDAT